MAKTHALANLDSIRRTIADKNPSANSPIVRSAKWAGDSARDRRALVRRRSPDEVERSAGEDMMQATLAPRQRHQMPRMDRATR